MKFTRKEDKHYWGEGREVIVFAYLPITIDDKTVWLEKCRIFQKYRGRHKGWENWSFMDL